MGHGEGVVHGKNELQKRVRQGIGARLAGGEGDRACLFLCGLVVLVSLASLAAYPPAAAAQISPGPLSRPHQSLNGSTNCASCHKFGGQAALKCLECHTEIASRLSARRGLHATYNIPPGSSQECARCHSEHNGEDFPIIKWDTKTFNHKETGYQLEGKHAGLNLQQVPQSLSHFGAGTCVD